ncbi:DUF4405 domain-containing protein [Fictibacillus sp. KIGAM418]|uniref:DUF4405 domain-containing protein n=1 Tax=Fictibacillus marinisediminis TaxID=2878389 RepID=A0A9X2BFT8_9BACL|nr:DUF4405 domain-containing protein [Fictibacillus marinisediminis]MCK6259120.1 DUF4405 domain-containing protein [Fictibacillus marinisediminis]
MKKNNYVKFGLDLAMSITFVLLFNKRVFGGMTFHEVAGTVIGVAFLTHMALNWRWIKNVSLKLFDKKLPGKTRFSYGLNLVLLVCMTTIMVSGIFVSRVLFPNTNIGNEGWFKMLHISLSFLTLIIVGIHVGMHWKWVINIWNRIFSIKEPKQWMGWTANGAMAVVLLFGVFQIFETGFISRSVSVFGIFSSGGQPAMAEGGKGAFGQRPDMDGDGGGQEFGGPRPGEQASGTSDGGQSGRPAPGSFSKGERPSGFDGDDDMGGGREREDFGGREHGFGGDVSALSVIATYTGVMAVFAVLAYYGGKFLGRRKKRLS